MAYFIHINGQSEDGSGAFVTYWYARNDLGIGISYAVDHSQREIGLRDARPASVQYSGNESVPPETYETDMDELWCFIEIAAYPIDDDEPSFWFPTGVVPAHPIKGVDPDEIAEGYAVDNHDDEYLLEAVVDRRRLWPIFHKMFQALPSSDGFEIRLLDHWEENGTTEVWVGDDRYAGATILQYLEAHPLDLVENGGVEIAVYCRNERATLRLKEHKLLGFYSPSLTHVRPMEKAIRNLGYHKRTELLSIATRCAHYHYAPAFSVSRALLVKRLQDDGFELAESWQEDTR